MQAQLVTHVVRPWRRLLQGLTAFLALTIGALCLPSSAGAAEGDKPDNAAIVNSLLEVVRDKNADRAQRINACAALKDYPELADLAVPTMVAFLQELAPEAPAAFSPYHPAGRPGLELVAAAIGEMGPKAESAVPELTRILGAQLAMENYKRGAAARALGKIGSDDAFLALKKASDSDRDRGVRKAIVAGLKDMAAKNKDAAILLQRIAKIDPDAGVRAAAGPPKEPDKPMDGEKKPEDGEKKPEDGEKKPEDGEKKPMDGVKKPGKPEPIAPPN